MCVCKPRYIEHDQHDRQPGTNGQPLDYTVVKPGLPGQPGHFYRQSGERGDVPTVPVESKLCDGRKWSDVELHSRQRRYRGMPAFIKCLLCVRQPCFFIAGYHDRYPGCSGRCYHTTLS